MTKSPMAFRAQLVIPEQRDIYDTWLDLCAGRPMPRRSDVSPRSLKRHLGLISMVDVEGQGDDLRFRYRLAGTGLRDLFGIELTGHYVDELPFLDGEDFAKVVARRWPAQGVASFPADPDVEFVQFWLKLPLSDDGETVNKLLCYDTFVHAPKAMALAHQSIAARA